ncbi:MAG: helix-turn-helix transcriptional regulator, partial [Acidimicrobiales bacterium]|nr:helix-turn-helix transcriptional regulator [Acidimicrobiales bacterium]
MWPPAPAGPSLRSSLGERRRAGAGTLATVPADVDPRIERSREQILAAAIDLLREVGYGGLTIEAVAARSGVAKSTIYRHWSSKA